MPAEKNSAPAQEQPSCKPPPNELNPDISNNRKKPLPTILGLLVISLILAAGIFLAYMFVQTGPQAKRAQPIRKARLVETVPVVFSNHQITIEGMGTVRPSREIDLFPQVSGTIQWVSPGFIPGGNFETGETLLQIDPIDYELIVEERKSELIQASSSLKLEQGQQNVALREFELLGESVKAEDRDLILRLPQLKSVQAEVNQTKAALEKARLDLKRTTITAPFRAVIKTREVNLGASVTPATKLATLIGTDEYWVEVLVPVDQLQWIDIPGINASKGAIVEIFESMGQGNGPSRDGQVIRLVNTVETEGQMARLLVAVKNPLSRSDNPRHAPSILLIDAFVRVRIAGRRLTQTTEIQRGWLRNGNTVWLMNDKNELEIRPVNIAYRGRDQVFVTEGLLEGERIVITNLAAPVQGMPLRKAESTAKEETGAPPS